MKAYEDLTRLKVDEALQQGRQGASHRQVDAFLPPDFSLLVDSRRAGGTRFERRKPRELWQGFSADVARATASLVLRARAMLRGI